MNQNAVRLALDAARHELVTSMKLMKHELQRKRVEDHNGLCEQLTLIGLALLLYGFKYLRLIR